MSETPSGENVKAAPARRKYVPVVGPRLRVLLGFVFALFALLVINSVYLVSIRILGAGTGESYEDWFFLMMFLAHVVLGLAIILPIVLFGTLHMRNARHRPNRRAVRAGYALFTTSLLILITGVALLRIDGLLVIKDHVVRDVVWWLHAITPCLAAWLFVLHRLAGRRIKWRVGVTWSVVAAIFAIVMVIMQSQDPRQWNVEGNPDGDQYFFPSLSRTVTGNFIPAEVLQNDAYCLECHADIHHDWSQSVHRFSSFNNPAYLASVIQTREFSMERDGTVTASRFCAGCHDPVPFFSGQFNDPEYDMENHPTATAGVTCTVCHAITHINSVRGNADYTIEEPIHYPFAASGHPVLSWVNRQLVKAKPEFHRKTFLKPLHQSPEFCGTCHKVHLPEELNEYKWLRGQNHYDAFWLSGVSGHGVTSFYYPPVAEVNCNGCHMPLHPSADFGARRDFDDSGLFKVHDHMFPSANTAIPTMVQMPDPQGAIAKHQEFLEGVVRVDMFGVHEEGRIGGTLTAPIRPDVPTLTTGESYLLDIIIRTVKMGHVFTQGTADSNQVWMEVTVSSDDRIVGRSGEMDDQGQVDPWSHFVNAFVIDREGHRIDRRNAQDIFTSLYNHQIPPGAADVIHYLLHVPEDLGGSLTVDVRLLYRKFDTTYMRFVHDDPAWINDLPVTVLAEDSVTFPVDGAGAAGLVQESAIPPWQRWNDYGIGLFRKGDLGELRGAEEAFSRVEAMGKPDGAINLARVYIKEGRVAQDAPAALSRAAAFDPPARQWHLHWFGGLVNKQNGHLDEAITDFRHVLAGGYAQGAGRGFDFAKDYRVLNELGNTLFLQAKQERGDARREERAAILLEAAEVFDEVLSLDPENAVAHYHLLQIHKELGNDVLADTHAQLHERYRVDDNARDHAISAARQQYEAANHAAESVVIYDLNRSPEGERPRSGK